MWAFCLRSLLREYGWQFLRRVAVPHPVRTARAVLDSGALDFSGNMTEISIEGSGQGLEDARSIIGAGFCLRDLRFQPGKSRDREGGGRRGARQRLECVRYGGDEGCLRIFFIFFLEWGQSTNTKAPISEVGW